MMKPFKLSFLFCLLCVTFMINAQKLPADSIIKKFNHFRTHTLQEKLYVHTDRTAYLTGEILWFKIYYVDASFHRALDVSKVAYVELLDKDQESVIQAKVELKNGAGSGSLFIPASVHSGNYVLRAYTNWMKNFNPEFYFHQPITIINTFVKAEQESKPRTTNYEVGFFPEGGNLIAGLSSKIGFRVADPSGKGIDFRGALLNSANDTVAAFHPFRLGIGHFNFTPVAGEKYKVVIRDTQGHKSAHAFPEVRSAGYTMTVNDNKEMVEVDISENSKEEGVPLVYLFVHARQVMIKAEGSFLRQGKAHFTLSKNDLGEGINHFTVFDDQFQPVAERLFFKRPKQKLDIEIQTVQKEYAPRGKVTLNVKGNTAADVSISVYKMDSLSFSERQNIHAYLMLTSDLKGTVESPEFYFNTADSVADKALDNLMLTHGWRRFKWTEVIRPKTNFQYPPEFRGHIVTGKVTGPNGAPATGVLAYLSSPDKLIQIYGSRSNGAGEVRFELQNFLDERKIYAQTNTRVDSLFRVTIESPFSSQPVPLPTAPFQLSPAIEKQLISRSIALQVQDIYSREQINRVVKPVVDSISFFGKADETYKLDDFTRFPLLEEVLREYVPGVLVRKRRDGFHFMVLDHVNKSIFRDDPMVLLDGVPVFNNDRLLAFSPLKIKKLEVLDREYYLGQLTFHGAILLSTYQGDLGGFELDPRTFSMNYEGLQLQREFYSPLYENEQSRNSRVPDQRTLLYWNPSVELNSGSNQTVQFYTSDGTGEYQVVIEGLSKDGVAGSSFYYFSVKAPGQ